MVLDPVGAGASGWVGAAASWVVMSAGHMQTDSQPLFGCCHDKAIEWRVGDYAKINCSTAKICTGPNADNKKVELQFHNGSKGWRSTECPALDQVLILDRVHVIAPFPNHGPVSGPCPGPGTGRIRSRSVLELGREGWRAGVGRARQVGRGGRGKKVCKIVFLWTAGLWQVKSPASSPALILRVDVALIRLRVFKCMRNYVSWFACLCFEMRTDNPSQKRAESQCDYQTLLDAML